MVGVEVGAVVVVEVLVQALIAVAQQLQAPRSTGPNQATIRTWALSTTTTTITVVKRTVETIYNTTTVRIKNQAFRRSLTLERSSFLLCAHAASVACVISARSKTSVAKKIAARKTNKTQTMMFQGLQGSKRSETIVKSTDKIP